MKKGTNAIILAGLILGFLAVSLLLLRPAPEPTYQGKTVLEWTIQLCSATPQTDKRAVAALRALGEPAVQRLTRMVEA